MPKADYEGRKPWERLEQDTTKSWHAFVYYRDLGSARTLKAVERQKKILYKTIVQWAKKYNWKERAIAYDQYLDDKGRDAMEDEILQMKRRQARLGVLMQSKGHSKLKDTDPDFIRIDEAIKLIEKGVNIERLARGLTTGVIETVEKTKEEKQEEEEENIDLFKNLSDDDLRELQRLTTRAFGSSQDSERD